MSTAGDQVGARRCDQVERRRELAGRLFGVARVRPVGLVHRDHVGELEHALLDALQLVAGAGEHEQQEEVDHVGDRGLRLPDADGLDEHDVVAGGLDDDDRLAGRARARRRACPRSARVG